MKFIVQESYVGPVALGVFQRRAYPLEESIGLIGVDG
jgi:hypothetical protein